MNHASWKKQNIPANIFNVHQSTAKAEIILGRMTQYQEK